MKISHTLAMAKRPGVSATFHIIVVEDQRVYYTENTLKMQRFFG